MPAARILIADDHEIARQGVAAMIAAHPGWDVCGEARTGREALQAAGKLRPDLVVIDILMPDLNGLDAARQIKKALPSVEILILSGHEEPELIRAAFDAGIRAFIFKRHAREHLLPAITALLARKPYLTAETSEILFSQFDRRQQAAAEPGSPAEEPLTAREREIVQMLAEGHSNKEIASTLEISTKTVETHRASIMRKLNLPGLSDIVLYAIRHRIIEA